MISPRIGLIELLEHRSEPGSRLPGLPARRDRGSLLRLRNSLRFRYRTPLQNLGERDLRLRLQLLGHALSGLLRAPHLGQNRAATGGRSIEFRNLRLKINHLTSHSSFSCLSKLCYKFCRHQRSTVSVSGSSDIGQGFLRSEEFPGLADLRGESHVGAVVRNDADAFAGHAIETLQKFRS